MDRVCANTLSQVLGNNFFLMNLFSSHHVATYKIFPINVCYLLTCQLLLGAFCAKHVLFRVTYSSGNCRGKKLFPAAAMAPDIFGPLLADHEGR
jgi:hypothetical protein